MTSVRVGLLPSTPLSGGRRSWLGPPPRASTTCALATMSASSTAGSDGLIAATALLVAQTELPVYVGLYLLPLRHPVSVARQLATLAELAPGRLTLGVGSR